MNTKTTSSKVRELTGTRKREFFLTTATSISPTSGWSGGSRDYYTGMNYRTGEAVNYRCGDCFSTLPVEQDIPAHSIVIKTGIFCGKPAYAVITCRPEELDAVKEFLGVF